MKKSFISSSWSVSQVFCQRAVAIVALTGLGLPLLTAPLEASGLENNPKAIVDEVWQLVNAQFVDRQFNQVNWLAKRQELLSHSYTNSKQAYQAIRAALKELGDPYTRFLAPEEFSQLTDETSGEMSGIGVRIAVEPHTKDLFVVDAVKNSPAIKAGVKAGDRVVRINGKPTALMSLEDASKEIQGKIGTSVNLQISRANKGVFTVTIAREKIELPTVSYSLKKEDQFKVGYIKLDEFSSHATEQMKEAIEDLSKQKVTGFVLDLRGNPGGLLFASVDIARLWMNQGGIVSTVDRIGGDKKFAANGTSITDLPLVVLVNEGSASASEILTGALKENKRAIVVGTTTYGKGIVQSVHTLSDGSGLSVTVAHYYLPSGTDINHKGITPDVYVDLTNTQQSTLENDPSLLATNADPQYKQAVSVLKKARTSLESQVLK
jgi:carboxyl-terminal processing protease